MCEGCDLRYAGDLINTLLLEEVVKAPILQVFFNCAEKSITKVTSHRLKE
ncbi:hypothetical protein Bsph_1939 [Lysinibacillus sphaericus C3-41]|uniref:Uncharacterized protein n=1 Tax=Lysinibacillus sphaericus (strain C3-41) TaxID=444177 RepID=B1HTB2_LYSSC|nr:hypothetical protein Bsph_1939 [Lysinibacillus sphaericus C3-41]